MKELAKALGSVAATAAAATLGVLVTKSAYDKVGRLISKKKVA